jgi:hypothetical protein
MLPRMIDIARAMLPGGKTGDYQIGRGMSAFVFAKLGISAPEFIHIVETASSDEDVGNRLFQTEQHSDYRSFSARLAQVTVASVPPEMRPDFERYYGSALPLDMKFFDVLDEDDIKTFS